MSIGYIPKKRKNARHHRRMRKKYKNFSCLTCAFDSTCFKRERRFSFSRGVEFLNVEYCPDWKASEEAKRGYKVTNTCDVDMPKKRALIKNISKFFKH